MVLWIAFAKIQGLTDVNSNCLLCLISGEVQGVWFRSATRVKAKKLWLERYARNLPDNRVEILTDDCSSKFNDTDKLNILGIVTTGNFWQFSKLFGNSFTQEVISYSAVADLQKMFDILNWSFIEAKKSIIL